MLSSYDMLLGLALLHERNQRQENAVFGWSGVLVQAAEKQILIEQHCLKEIVTVDKVTRVIDHRSWLVGLMSYEGAIIPLIELRSFVNAGSPSLGLRNRSILVVPRQNGHIGLLVDKVIGSRNYWSDDDFSDFKVCKEGCAKVSFSHKKKHIEVCDIEKLAATIGLRREEAKVV